MRVQSAAVTATSSSEGPTRSTRISPTGRWYWYDSPNDPVTAERRKIPYWVRIESFRPREFRICSAASGV